MHLSLYLFSEDIGGHRMLQVYSVSRISGSMMSLCVSRVLLFPLQRTTVTIVSQISSVNVILNKPTG